MVITAVAVAHAASARVIAVHIHQATTAVAAAAEPVPAHEAQERLQPVQRLDWEQARPPPPVSVLAGLLAAQERQP